VYVTRRRLDRGDGLTQKQGRQGGEPESVAKRLESKERGVPALERREGEIQTFTPVTISYLQAADE